MKRADKELFVEQFRDRLEKAPVFYLTDFTGLDVKSITTLRAELRKTGAEYLVVKNRLAMRAFAETDLPDLTESLTGPTAVVFGYEGAVEPAKAIADFAKEHEDKPVFKIGVLDQKILEPKQIERLAKLPPKDELLAELAGAMQQPMTALAGAMQAKVQEMAGLLDAYKAQRGD